MHLESLVSANPRRMPEGPEIKRAADRLGRALERRPVTEAFFAFPELEHHADHVLGRPVEKVRCRGKAMLIEFGPDLVIYSHNQLYGRWYVTAAGKTPKTNRQLRLALHNEKNSAWLYSASDIDVLARDELDQHPFLKRLGPDILDPETTVADIRSQLDRYRRRQLASILLDQGVLCGLGNYLRSEILFVTGILPERRPCDLEEHQLDELAEAILTITKRAYRTRGITTPDALARELKEAGLPRSDFRHHVFARGGKPCRQCGTIIERVEVSGRRIYICPVCQS